MTALKEQYRITPADREKDLMAITKVISDAFAGGLYLEEISKKYVGGCHYDFETSRLIWDRDELVHHWGVWGYPMRVGSILLKSAGIGAVVTLEDYRKQGLMTWAVEESFIAMRKNGYDLSILRGRHYYKFGYRRAWNYVTTKLNPTHQPPEPVPDFDLKLPYRPLGPDDMAQVTMLYNQQYGDVSGSCVRPTYPMLEEGEMGAYGWFDGEQLLGYVRALAKEDKSAVQCLEATGDPEQGLAVLRELIEKEACAELHFFTMPKDHPILQIIRQGACTIEDRYFRHTGWQVKVINLESTLTKLLPLFEDRLAHSHLSGWQGRLGLDGDDGEYALEIHAGKVAVSDEIDSPDMIAAGPSLGRLLIGSDDPVEIVRQEGVDTFGMGGELLTVLFPNLNPMMSHWDEF
jgi:hypothetical protein